MASLTHAPTYPSYSGSRRQILNLAATTRHTVHEACARNCHAAWPGSSVAFGLAELARRSSTGSPTLVGNAERITRWGDCSSGDASNRDGSANGRDHDAPSVVRARRDRAAGGRSARAPKHADARSRSSSPAPRRDVGWAGPAPPLRAARVARREFGRAAPPKPHSVPRPGQRTPRVR